MKLNNLAGTSHLNRQKKNYFDKIFRFKNVETRVQNQHLCAEEPGSL